MSRLQPKRLSRGRIVDYSCDCLGDLTNRRETATMPKAKKVVQDADLCQVYIQHGTTIADIIRLLYIRKHAIMFSVTRRGAISITVFAGDDREKYYIESVGTAELALDEMIKELVDQE